MSSLSENLSSRRLRGAARLGRRRSTRPDCYVSAAIGRGRSGDGPPERWRRCLTADRRWRWRRNTHGDHWCNQEQSDGLTRISKTVNAPWAVCFTFLAAARRSGDRVKQRSVRLWHKADMVFIIASSPDDWVSTHSIG